MRQENELLCSMTQSTSDTSASATIVEVTVTNLKEMLPLFDGKTGSYSCWKEQLLTVKQIYQLDDDMAKLLLVMKLTDNAMEWFHSVPSHLSLTLDELLMRMEAMYGLQKNKYTLRKEFENRVWQYGETTVIKKLFWLIRFR